MLPRWETICTDYPIELWKRLLGKDILLGGGQQLLVNPIKGNEGTGVISNVKMAFGQACANLYNGCDFVYLYNYMDIAESGIEEMNHSTSIRSEKNLKKILSYVGDYATASKQERSHVLTYDDFLPYWQKAVSRLPVRFEDDRWQFVKITAGGVGEEENAYLVLCFDRQLRPEDITVFVNCEATEFKGYGGLDENISRLAGHIFKINNQSNVSGYYVIEMQVTPDAVLGYAEITISKRDL